jgi:hypothetical protein
MTMFGIDQVRMNQRSSTPALNLSRAIVQVTGQFNQVMVDPLGGYQSAQHTFNSGDVVHALQEYRNALRSVGLDAESTRQAEKYLAIAESELRSSRPNEGVLRSILGALRQIALEAAGNAVWAGVAALLARVLAQ